MIQEEISTKPSPFPQADIVPPAPRSITTAALHQGDQLTKVERDVATMKRCMALGDDDDMVVDEAPLSSPGDQLIHLHPIKKSSSTTSSTI
ncbi:unnamed protein product [Lactuca saligna]|uniref:Uncharacterized protein n=1 Tax=Lactuca saligna TaxID=75948 RepID=A0AA36EES0_LACSI|nr:unnamed protein product [Lactuca saligna]